MLSYIINMHIIWGIGLLIFYLFFEKSTFFRLNRIFLLVIIVLGAIGPLMFQYLVPSSILPQEFIFLLPIVTINGEQIAVPSGLNFIAYITIKNIYLVGVLLSFVFFINNIIHILKIKKVSVIEKIGATNLALNTNINNPFSFLNTIYWNPNWVMSKQEKESILQHELAHIKHKHSWDIIFLQAIKSIFWFSPISYLFQYLIKLIHEYEADSFSIKTTSVKLYGQIIIEQFLLSKGNQLANNFLPHFLKKRIIMMTKTPFSTTFKKYYFLGFIALFSSSIFISSCVKDKPNPSQEVKKIPKVGETINGEIITSIVVNEDGTFNYCTENNPYSKYLETDTIMLFDTKTQKEEKHVAAFEYYKLPEVMPEFPGGQSAMMQYIYSTVKYPDKARKSNIEGIAVVQFVIHEDGKVGRIKIVRSVSPEIDKEVIRIVENMPQWSPGSIKGKKVNVQFHLPVKFKLE